jgi:hypothetical protein
MGPYTGDGVLIAISIIPAANYRKIAENKLLHLYPDGGIDLLWSPEVNSAVLTLVISGSTNQRRQRYWLLTEFDCLISFSLSLQYSSFETM